MRSKKQLYIEMKENALLSKPDFESEEFDAKIILQNKNKATPLTGYNLFRWCGYVGAMILNADDIQDDQNYYLEFRGCGSYLAIKA